MVRAGYPLPSVLPAFDFSFDVVDGFASLLPAFDNACLVGFGMDLTSSRADGAAGSASHRGG